MSRKDGIHFSSTKQYDILRQGIPQNQAYALEKVIGTMSFREIDMLVKALNKIRKGA